MSLLLLPRRIWRAALATCTQAGVDGLANVSLSPNAPGRHPDLPKFGSSDNSCQGQQVTVQALSRPSTLGTALGLLAGLLVLLGAQPWRVRPVIVFDEAYGLMLARHLSRTGEYAMQITGTKLRWFDPEASTGPTVLVPQAIGLLTSNSPLLVPRVIMLAYLGLFTAALFLAGRRLGGWLGGTLATVTLLWVSWDIYDLGLRVLGEFPSLAFFCLGTIALTRTSPRGWLIGGTCIGLALLTKPQMIIAVAALFLILGLWHHRCDRHCQTSTLCAVIGVALPVALWESIQLVILGPAEWYRVKEAVFFLTTSEGFAGGFSSARVLLNYPPIAASIILVLCIAYYLLIHLTHRISDRITFTLRILALLSVAITFPFIHWNTLTLRLLSLWNAHALETSIAVVGLLLGAVLALIKNDRGLAFVAVSGILFAEWSLGISQISPNDTVGTLGFSVRYTSYWRILGLLGFAVVGAALLRYLGQQVVRHVGQWPAEGSRWAGAFGLLAALGGAGILVAHALPQISYTRSGEPEGGFGATAGWVASNTASDALLLGDGWWMPWEVAYLANRDVGDVRTSGFSKPSDLRRPLYLAIDETLLGNGWLLPSTEAALRREDLRLFRGGAYAIAQWPRSPVFEALSKMESVDLNVLEEIEAGHATLTPAPREGVLDPKHGQFIFPSPMELRQGVTMISPASVSTRPFGVQQTSRLLLGYTPPDAGDGLRLTVSLRGPNNGEEATPLWQRDIAPGGAYELHEIALESVSAPEKRLTVSVSSPSGNTSADWLQISPLIVGSW